MSFSIKSQSPVRHNKIKQSLMFSITPTDHGVPTVFQCLPLMTVQYNPGYKATLTSGLFIYCFFFFFLADEDVSLKATAHIFKAIKEKHPSFFKDHGRGRCFCLLVDVTALS